MEKKMYVVGGWCRDTIIGRIPNDTDYVAIGYKVSDLSLLSQVGTTFPVFLTKGGDEVALGRREQSVGDSHTDFLVDCENVTLEEDLSRRDLTINAIAYDRELGVYIDPFNGQQDLKNKVLRHVSEAFADDPLRVLRLARLRSQLGGDFTITPATKALCYSMRDKLGSLTPERVWKEAEKALITNNPSVFFNTLLELGVLDVVFPEIFDMVIVKEGIKWHREYSVYEHTMKVLDTVTPKCLTARLVALYHDIGKPKSYREYGNGSSHDKVEVFSPLITMKMPVRLREDVIQIVSEHIRINRYTDMNIGKKIDFLESFRTKELLTISIQLALADTAGATVDSHITKDVEFNSTELYDLYDALSKYKASESIDNIREQTPRYIQARIRYDKCQIIRDYYKKG